MTAIQLEKLEEDFIVSFITGKPLIESPAHNQLRKVFKFKKEDLGDSQE